MQSVYHHVRALSGRAWVLAAVVALAAFALYVGVTSHGFVADDFIFLHQLRFKQPQLVDNLVYFGRDWGMGADFYRPLARLYWALLHAIWGESAWGWHLAGAALYSATCALVSLLALRLSGRYGVGLLAGLIFAMHPAHAETVSWVANSSDLLAGLFCLLATLFYVMARSPVGAVREPMLSDKDSVGAGPRACPGGSIPNELGRNRPGQARGPAPTARPNFNATALVCELALHQRRNALYLLAALCFFLALLSKESAAGFILVPVAYDLIFGIGVGRSRVKGTATGIRARHLRQLSRGLARQLPFVGTLAVYLWLRWSALGGIGGYASGPGEALSLGAFVEVYAKWLLMPLVLNRTLLWVLFVAIVAGLTAVVVYWERRATIRLPGNSAGGVALPHPPPSPTYRLLRTGGFGLCWLIFFLLPTATTPPSVRFVYLPTVGVALLWAILLAPILALFWDGAAGSVKWLRTWQAVSWLKLGVAGALLLLSAGDTLHHLDAWLRAGQTTHDILSQIREGRPQPEDYTPIYAAVLPQANEDALIFRTGFPEAVQLLYGNTTVEGISVATFHVVELGLNEAYFVEYREGRIVARDDIVADLQERNKQIKAKAEQPFVTWDFRATPGATPGPSQGWQIVSGAGSLEALPGGLQVRLSDGGYIRPPTFRVDAPALAKLELVAKGTATTSAQESAQLVIHWLVETPQGPSERASAPLPIALDGESHTYKIKPTNMLPFALNDTVIEIRVELPVGIASLTIEQARLFKLPWR